MISRKIKKRIRKQEKQGIKKAREKKELQEGRKEGETICDSLYSTSVKT